MGTRSLIEVRQGNQVLMTMYRQSDGYLTGVGAELKELVCSKTMVNGIPDSDRSKYINGMDCLAAQIVASMKDGAGNVYLYPPGSRDVGEEYIYLLSEKEGEVWLDVYEGGVTFFGASQKDAGLDDQAPEVAPAIYSGLIKDFDPEACEQKYHVA